MNSWFFIAAILSAGICLLHITLGGRAAAAPLLAAEGMGKVARYTNYYCWHIVTIVILGLAAAFAIAAFDASERTLALFATIGAVSFCAWSLTMIAIFKLRPMNYPQWLLFLPVAGLGIAGLWG